MLLLSSTTRTEPYFLSEVALKLFLASKGLDSAWSPPLGKTFCPAPSATNKRAKSTNEIAEAKAAFEEESMESAVNKIPFLSEEKAGVSKMLVLMPTKRGCQLSNSNHNPKILGAGAGSMWGCAYELTLKV